MPNILVDDFTPVISDFSMTKPFVENGFDENSHTPTAACLMYRSPEVYARKKYGYELDNWGVGIILFEIFRGKRFTPPFDGDIILFINKQVETLALARSIRGLLNPNPAERWTCKDVLIAFNKPLLSDEPVWSPTQTIQSHCTVTEEMWDATTKFKKLTMQTVWAAQIYCNKTGITPTNALILASKLYMSDDHLVTIDYELSQTDSICLNRMGNQLFV